MRVLIADDDHQMRGWLLRAMKALGHAVEAVSDGNELVRRAEVFAPDAVISDIGMPLCDGIQAGLRLRRSRPGLPLILMTGDPMRAREARRTGFRPVLLKPFALEELTAALSSF